LDLLASYQLFFFSIGPFISRCIHHIFFPNNRLFSLLFLPPLLVILLFTSMMSSSRHSGSRSVATRSKRTRSASQDEEPLSPARSLRVRLRRPHASDHFDSDEEKKEAMLIDAPEAHSNGVLVSTNRRRGRKRRQASNIPQASDAGNEEHANDATAIDVDLINQDNQDDSKYDVPLSLASNMHDYNHSSAFTGIYVRKCFHHTGTISIVYAIDGK
jgi:hypothetical protein